VVEIRVPTGGEIQLCLRIDGDLNGAESEIESRRGRLRFRPDAWKKRLELAEMLYHCARWDEAQEEYRRVLAANAACYAASFRLADILAQGLRQGEAAEILRSEIDHGAPAPAMARLRAEMLAAERRDEEAVEAYRRAISVSPREAENHYGLHISLGRLSRYQDQLDNLAQLRTIAPKDMFGYVQAYTPCARIVRFDIALPIMERAGELDPTTRPQSSICSNAG